MEGSRAPAGRTQEIRSAAQQRWPELISVATPVGEKLPETYLPLTDAALGVTPVAALWLRQKPPFTRRLGMYRADESTAWLT